MRFSQKKLFEWFEAVLIAALLLPFSSSASPPDSSKVYGTYVLLAQAPDGQTVPFVRVIVEQGYDCPAVVGGNSPLPMTPRDNPHGFPVVVCEATIGFEQNLQVELKDSGVPLPTVRKDPGRIVLFGDTGCKKLKEGASGGCADGTPAEPFATLAKAAESGPRPDLLLHMGDYNYRGTPGHILMKETHKGKPVSKKHRVYDAGDGEKQKEQCQQSSNYGFISQNDANSTSPDSWENWRIDFFEPAGKLLTAAPWLFARGNHELCSRAGPGWFYFLDPSSNLPQGGGKQLRCPVPDAKGKPIENTVLRHPYAVDLGTLSMIVLDSSNACDDQKSGKDFMAIYEAQFKQIEKLIPSKNTTWFMTHRPIWGVTDYDPKISDKCTSEKQYGCINQTLQAGIKHTMGSLPDSVKLVLAGHMHRFQSLTSPNNNYPPQLIVGNGGVALAGSQPTGTFVATVGGKQAIGRATGRTVKTRKGAQDAFGYLDIVYSDNGGWKGTLIYPPGGFSIADCGSKQALAGSVCEFSKDILK